MPAVTTRTTTTTKMMMMTMTMTMTKMKMKTMMAVALGRTGERAEGEGHDTVPAVGTRTTRTRQTRIARTAAMTTGGINLVAGTGTAGGAGTRVAVGLSCGTSRSGC